MLKTEISKRHQRLHDVGKEALLKKYKQVTKQINKQTTRTMKTSKGRSISRFAVRYYLKCFQQIIMRHVKKQESTAHMQGGKTISGNCLCGNKCSKDFQGAIISVFKDLREICLNNRDVL